LKAMRGNKRIMTASTTALNPRFAGATNPLRDAIEVFAKTEANANLKDLAVGWAESIKNIAGRSALANEAQRHGLGGTSMFFHASDPATVARLAAPVSIADKARNTLRKGAAPLHGAEKLGEASDMGPRLAEYRATLRNFQHKVDSGEWTPAELRLRAATNARGVTMDFANRPGDPTLAAFADYIPFFAVGLQAPVAFSAAVARNPARAMGVMAGVATASLLAWAVTRRAGADTQRLIRDRPPTERAAFIIVPAGGGNVVRFPIGAELGLVHTAVTAAMDQLDSEDPNTGEMVTEALVRSLPPGIGELAQGNPWGAVAVPGVQQAIEIGRNKTNYGDRPVVPKRFEGVAAAEKRQDTTAPTFDLLAAGARKLGGVLGETSPLEAEHMVRGTFSSATPLITSLTDPIAQKIMGRGGAEERVPERWYHNPVNPVSAVIAKNPPAGTQSENDYYNTK
jgi:hypothetical protein